MDPNLPMLKNIEICTNISSVLNFFGRYSVSDGKLVMQSFINNLKGQLIWITILYHVAQKYLYYSMVKQKNLAAGIPSEGL